MHSKLNFKIELYYTLMFVCCTAVKGKTHTTIPVQAMKESVQYRYRSTHSNLGNKSIVVSFNPRQVYPGKSASVIHGKG
jgi:hypothetical protein